MECLWMTDSYGMEALRPYDKHTLFCMELRARYNPQRFPTIGTATLKKEVFEYINELIGKGKKQCQEAWYLIGGTSEEKFPIVARMLTSDDKAQQRVAELICEGFEVNVLSGNDKFLKKYKQLFELDL
jgi:hypothetical protein